MERYSNSSIYPISEDAIESIATNMRINGFDPDFPIVVRSGEIIDGWHRYQASQRAGVEPQFREFAGDDNEVLRYVLRANGDRRHLNGGQKAAAAIIINRRIGGEAKDMANIAKEAGISEGNANRLASCSDEDLNDVVNGKKTQQAVRESTAKATKGQSTTYTLSRPQAAKVASLSVTLDQRGKQVLVRAFDLGLKAMEEQVTAMAPAK